MKTVTSATTTRQFLYDSNGGLVKLLVSNGTASSTYDYINDGLGNRIEVRKNGAVQFRFFYDGRGRLAGYLDSTGMLTQYIYGSGGESPDAMVVNGTNYLLTHDQVGSVRSIVAQASGQTVSRLDYDEFGNVAPTSLVPDFQPLGFGGGIRDFASGLIRFGARDYEPETGRWTGKDPILFDSGDTNVYAYVLQDPINWIDPDGMQATLPFPFPIEFPIPEILPVPPTGLTPPVPLIPTDPAQMSNPEAEECPGGHRNNQRPSNRESTKRGIQEEGVTKEARKVTIEGDRPEGRRTISVDFCLRTGPRRIVV